MKNNITEIVFILDRSGSMAGYESDAVGGFNATVEKQKKLDGTAYVSTILFSNNSTVLHDRVELGSIQPMTEKDYTVGGGTALMDAIGQAIDHIGSIHKYARKEDVPEHTVFVIMTDGMENASHTYTRAAVKKMITHRSEEYGWEFIFLASNIDATEAAQDIGIDRRHASGFTHDSQGFRDVHRMAACAISDLRRNGKIQDLKRDRDSKSDSN